VRAGLVQRERQLEVAGEVGLGDDVHVVDRLGRLQGGSVAARRRCAPLCPRARSSRRPLCSKRPM
jgi:hypothetical protein